MFERIIRGWQQLSMDLSPNLRRWSAAPGRSVRDGHKRQIKLRQQLQAKQTADFYYLIDVVGTCNLRCPSCPVGNYPEQPPKGLMSLENYRAILEKIAADHPGEKIFVDLYNWGGPGLHKRLGELIKLTKEFGFGVGISSNMNVFPDLKAVIQERPSYLRISLSGYFNETYQRTHRAGDINLVKSNMHMLRHWLDKTESDTIVQVGFHVYRSNFPEDFRKMRDLCEDLDFIFAPTVAALMPVEKAVMAVDGAALPEDRQILDNLVVPMAEWTSLVSRMRSEHPDCQYRQKRTTINFDGSVPLCCATFEQNQIIAPNFLDVSREEITARKYSHEFCGTCQNRFLDMVYTGVGSQYVEKRAALVLGAEYQAFLDEWNVSIEPTVAFEGRELTIPQAFRLAMKRLKAGKEDLAFALLKDVVREAPRHGEAHYQMGGLLLAKGHKENARASFRAAYEIWPHHKPYADAFKDIEGDKAP